MKALVKRHSKPGLWLEDVPEPKVGMNDVLIRNSELLTEFLRTNPPGTKVTVRVVRGDFFSGYTLVALDVTLGERDS